MKQLFSVCLGLAIITPTFAFNTDNIKTARSQPLFDTRSCNELYVEASALEKLSYADDYDYFNDRNARVAGIASTVFAPAIYYFGYAAYKDVSSKSEALTALSSINDIRNRMAEKRCFERH